MKLFIVAAFVLVADALFIKDEWQQFKLDYGKTYKSLREEKFRFSVFQKNLQMIQEHNEKFNKGEVTFAMKITQFTDMTDQELSNLVKLRKNTTPSTGREKFVPSGTGILKAKDWRKEGAVTTVKEQRDCSSCWAFSAIGAIEGQLFLKNRTLKSLSAQNLIDCDTEAHGCRGGIMINAYKYAKSHGITTEDEYPYVAETGKCRQNSHPTVSIKSFVELDEDEKTVTEALATVGPISAAINVVSATIMYSHGILDESSGCSNQAGSQNHGVLLVGYGEEGGVPYYIVKNSWGTKWGEEGYFRLKRNACAIQWDCTYPIV